MARIVIVHDVLGTLFGLDAPIDEVLSIFREQLLDASSNDKGHARMFAELVVMDWYHAAQRDFTTLSINGLYQPIAAVFKTTLPRILLQAGLVPPASFKKGDTSTTALRHGGAGVGIGASQSRTSYTAKGNSECGPYGAEVVDRVMGSLGRLHPRPGMTEAFANLYRPAGGLIPRHAERVDVWGATNGGLALAEKLFSNALGPENVGIVTGQDATSRLSAAARSSSSITEAKAHTVALYSCDENRVAKPHPDVYAEVKRRILAGDGSKANSTSLWFVASHTWDTFAAKQAGFKTAWVCYEEFDMCRDIYGTPDVTGTDLADVARQIMEAESTSSG